MHSDGHDNEHGQMKDDATHDFLPRRASSTFAAFSASARNHVDGFMPAISAAFSYLIFSSASARTLNTNGRLPCPPGIGMSYA